jgi:predicted TIM-barrel fold metal-dependent hydrolase
MLISADCHAGPPPATYRRYLPRDVHASYEAWLVEAERQRRRRKGLFDDEFMAGFEAEGADGLAGAWDAARRIRELEADGTVAEVVFPDSIVAGGAPFGAGITMNARPVDPALTLAGARAHNRWLADFCGASPGRRGGIAPIPIDDIAEALAELRWVREHVPHPGVLLPAGTGTLPLYHDPRYEPLWATCEELELPVHVHTGSGPPDYGEFPFAPILYVCEAPWFAHRPLTFVIWSGVLERHPRLHFVLTEQGAGWIPSVLAQWDDLFERPMFRHLRAHLDLKPSEYWARQCFVGASMLSRQECEVRHRIGVATMMWGSDYPHPEGTWPHTRQHLHETFAGVPEPELRAMLGATAARVYGFDPARLAGDVERVGPEPAELSASRGEDPRRAARRSRA